LGALLCSAPKMQLIFPPFLPLAGEKEGAGWHIKKLKVLRLYGSGLVASRKESYFCLFFRAPETAREKIGFFFPDLCGC